MSSHMGLELRSLVTPDGTLELSLQTVQVPDPAPDEVVIRVDAAPVNPSDLGALFGAADLSSVKVSGTGAGRVVTAAIPEKAQKAMAGRMGRSLVAGNEGAGEVVAAGASPEAQALLGKTVAALGGGMYAQFRAVKVDQCLVLPNDTSAAEGASAFVNPLTALGMIETMRMEKHTALVHTAAASNLGQMLVRLCLRDGVPLVSIVRKPEHVTLLHELGATHVCDTSAPSFVADLTAALVATGATLAFDAISGGRLAGQILTAMEAAILKSGQPAGRYGSSVHKQVYLYGGLDTGPTELVRNFGMAWGIGGWLVFPFLQRIGPVAAQRMKDRVAAEIKTTFASLYSREGSLVDMCSAEAIASYGKKATGEKYLVLPSKA